MNGRVLFDGFVGFDHHRGSEVVISISSVVPVIISIMILGIVGLLLLRILLLLGGIVVVEGDRLVGVVSSD